MSGLRSMLNIHRMRYGCLPVWYQSSTNNTKAYSSSKKGSGGDSSINAASGKKPIEMATNKSVKAPENENANKPSTTLKPEPNVAAGNSYRAPEYYEHGVYTFNDYEIDMKKMRLPQPSCK